MKRSDDCKVNPELIGITSFLNNIGAGGINDKLSLKINIDYSFVNKSLLQLKCSALYIDKDSKQETAINYFKSRVPANNYVTLFTDKMLFDSIKHIIKLGEIVCNSRRRALSYILNGRKLTNNDILDITNDNNTFNIEYLVSEYITRNDASVISLVKYLNEKVRHNKKPINAELNYSKKDEETLTITIQGRSVTYNLDMSSCVS